MYWRGSDVLFLCLLAQISETQHSLHDNASFKGTVHLKINTFTQRVYKESPLILISENTYQALKWTKKKHNIRLMQYIPKHIFIFAWTVALTTKLFSSFVDSDFVFYIIWVVILLFVYRWSTVISILNL